LEVRVAVATPPVVNLTTLLDPKLPKSVMKVTSVPSATGLPYRSVTVARSVDVDTPLAGIAIGSAVSVTVCGGSGLKTTSVTSYFESAVAVMTAVPAVVPEVKTAVAAPLAVVLVTVSLPKVPKLVTKVTSVPSATRLPPMSFTIAWIFEVCPLRPILVGLATTST
jgi:hypothetical protein